MTDATIEWIRLQTAILNLRNACAAEVYADFRGAAHGLTPRSPAHVLSALRSRAERMVTRLGITAPTAHQYRVVALDGMRECVDVSNHARPVTAARAEALAMLRYPGRRVVKVRATTTL